MEITQLRIFYASVSGTARQVAEAVQLALTEQVASLTNLQGAAAHEVFDQTVMPTLFCISTTGTGSLPEDALAVFAELQDSPRYLGALRYGLIALGDSSYGSTFCGGGLAFDAALLDLGAQRVGEILRLDASETDDPQQLAIEWVGQWLPKL